MHATHLLVGCLLVLGRDAFHSVPRNHRAGLCGRSPISSVAVCLPETVVAGRNESRHSTGASVGGADAHAFDPRTATQQTYGLVA